MRFRFFDVVSFNMSERTHFDALVKANPRLKRLEKEDVVALLSQTQTQLLWVHGYTRLDDGANVLTSTRLRLDKGTWSVLRLKEYADMIGIHVTNWSVLDDAMCRGVARTTRQGSTRNVMQAIRANVTYELISNTKRAA